ncbi:MAG: hypothetical protein ACJ8G1_07905, partial [Vitreoscilla sp.]
DAAAPASLAARAPASVPASAAPVAGSTSKAEDDPRHFLQRVMNDERIDMALRIEAAKALLQR